MTLQLRSRSQPPAAPQRFCPRRRCERRFRGSWKMECNGRQEENRGKTWRPWLHAAGCRRRNKPSGCRRMDHPTALGCSAQHQSVSIWQVPDTFADRLVQCQWWQEVQRPRWSSALPVLMLALLAALEEHLASGWSKDIRRDLHGCAVVHLYKGCEEFSSQELLRASSPLEFRLTWRIYTVGSFQGTIPVSKGKLISFFP